ncbi:hypothetical protein BGW39_010064 [Mortierella sp. 14UC]|nr:hypothetical protein BGW39_010064 [Mortierella sp. 14UC]
MWSASAKDKDKQQQRPPTPRWNPSIIVSPTTSLLHERHKNPKSGRAYSPLRQSSLSLSESEDQGHTQHYPHLQRTLSPNTSVEVSPPAMTDEQVHQLLQLQQALPEAIDPRHVSFTVQPNPATQTQLAMPSLPQLAHVQSTQVMEGQTPPLSMLGWSFSPEYVSWMPHGGSPFPLRSHSDPSDQSASESYTVAKQLESQSAPTTSDPHSDSGSSSAGSFHTVRPPVPGGKIPRLTIGGKNLALIRPSHLSIVENASSSEDLSTPRVTTPISKIPSTHGSSGSRRRSAYPGSSSPSTATSGSNSLSSLSDEFRSAMDVQIIHYVKQNDRRVKEIMDERLPMIFNTCEDLLRSMQEENDRVALLKKFKGGIASVDNRGRATTVRPNPIHDFGRLPAREFHRPHITAGWKPPGLKRDRTPLQGSRDDRHSSPFLEPKDSMHKQSIKEEAESIQSDDKNVHDDDALRTPSPVKRNPQGAVNNNEQHFFDPKTPSQRSPSPAVVSPSPKMSDPISPLLKSVTLESPSFKALSLNQAPVVRVDQQSPTNTTSHQEQDAKHSPQSSDSSRSSSSGESMSSARKRKRDQGSTSDQVEPARANAALQLDSAHDDHAAIATEASAGAGRVVVSDPSGASGGQSVMQKESSAGSSSMAHRSSSPLIGKKVNPLTWNNVGVAGTRAVAVDWGKELHRYLQSFQECCVYIMICLQQPQATSFSDHEGIEDSPPFKISTPIRHSGRSTAPAPSTPLSVMNFHNAPPSIKMKLKGEVSKVIKGVNDILAAIEKSDADRADLLTKIETHRANIDCSTRKSSGKNRTLAYDDDGAAAGMRIVGRDSALGQMEQNLEQLDSRQTSRVQFGVMELQSSCAGLHQMLRTVFV